MKEFKISEYITLKLEGDKTVIYVKEEQFKQCKLLLLDISVEGLKEIKEIESVDEVAKSLTQGIEDSFFFSNAEIPPETRFWAHCSNMQAWVESKYNSNLLHYSLAFPLLKKLTDLGDTFAKIKLQEEIIKRLESGYFSVIEFLINKNYLKYLKGPLYAYSFLESEEERIALNQINKCARNRNRKGFELVNKLDFFEDVREYPPGFFILIENKHVIGLDIHSNQLEEFPNAILKFKRLKKLYLDNNNIPSIPNDIGDLNSLTDLSLARNNISSIPQTIEKLKTLKNLGLDHNDLKEIPDIFSELSSFENIYLNFNHIDKIPESIGKCKKLKQLHLENNNLTSVPNSLSLLTSTDWINLRRNNLNEKNFDTLKKKFVFEKITY